MSRYPLPVVGVGGGVAVRVGATHEIHAVVLVGRDMAEGIGDGEHLSGLVVGVGDHAAVGVRLPHKAVVRVILVARHAAALVGELGEVVVRVVLQTVAAAVRRGFLYLVAEGVVLVTGGIAQRVRDGNDVAVLVVGIADLAAVRVHGFGRTLLRVEPDLAPVAVRVRGDGVIVVVGEIVLIHGAGRLAPRASVLIGVFCQNTQYRPLCSLEHKEPSPCPNPSFLPCRPHPLIHQLFLPTGIFLGYGQNHSCAVYVQKSRYPSLPFCHSHRFSRWGQHHICCQT